MTINYFLDFSRKIFGGSVIYFVKINYIPGFALCSKKRYIRKDIRKEQKISFSAFRIRYCAHQKYAKPKVN